MAFDEIKINQNTSYFKTKIDNIDYIQLIKDLNLNLSVNKHTSLPAENEPGIQSKIVIKTQIINKLNKLIYNNIFEFLGLDLESIGAYYTTEWVYVSDKFNKYTKYHTHNYSNTIYPSIDWSFVYYVQIPDNLKGDEGRLFFKTDNGEEYSFLPKKGELILFRSKLLHRPETNQNSKSERIVYAGGFVQLNYDTDYKKTKKGML